MVSVTVVPVASVAVARNDANPRRPDAGPWRSSRSVPPGATPSTRSRRRRRRFDVSTVVRAGVHRAGLDAHRQVEGAARRRGVVRVQGRGEPHRRQGQPDRIVAVGVTRAERPRRAEVGGQLAGAAGVGDLEAVVAVSAARRRTAPDKGNSPTGSPSRYRAVRELSVGTSDPACPARSPYSGRPTSISSPVRLAIATRIRPAARRRDRPGRVPLLPVEVAGPVGRRLPVQSAGGECDAPSSRCPANRRDQPPVPAADGLRAGYLYREQWNADPAGPAFGQQGESAWQWASRTATRSTSASRCTATGPGTPGRSCRPTAPVPPCIATVSGRRVSLVRARVLRRAAGDRRLPPRGRRHPQRGELTTHLSAAWTFRSGHADGDDPVRLPLSAVRFTPALDADDAAPAGRTFDLPVSVEASPVHPRHGPPC